MPQSAILTVRLPDADLKRLDALAEQRRQTRSQLVQETLQALLDSDEDLRKRELEALQERLRPAVEAQEELLERVSVADEHRRFWQMAQFDVRLNPSRQTGKTFPYLVEIQSDSLTMVRRRIVVPLARQATPDHIFPALNPMFQIRGEPVVLIPLDIASISESALGEMVGSLKEESDLIIAALDLTFARYWMLEPKTPPAW